MFKNKYYHSAFSVTFATSSNSVHLSSVLSNNAGLGAGQGPAAEQGQGQNEQHPTGPEHDAQVMAKEHDEYGLDEGVEGNEDLTEENAAVDAAENALYHATLIIRSNTCLLRLRTEKGSRGCLGHHIHGSTHTGNRRKLTASSCFRIFST